MTPRYDLDAWDARRWERRDATCARYYEARLVQDLWGEWLVQTVWGGLGSRLGDEVTEAVAHRDAGVALLEEIASRRVGRGYAVVQQGV